MTLLKRSAKRDIRRRVFFRLAHVKSTASIALIAALLLTGCGKKQAGGAGGPDGTEVGVLTIAPGPVTLTEDLPGRTSAYRVAEVRARVDGIVHKRLFTEGSEVKEGDVLYEIDPAPYEAALNGAEATLARAEANAATARAKEQRYQALLNARAISKQDYDDAVANLRSYEADVASGKAAVQTARINLGYTKVTAPVSGRIGISQVSEGAYVQASAATLLATIQQLDPINVDVTKSSTEFQQLTRRFASGQIKPEHVARRVSESEARDPARAFRPRPDRAGHG
jgi:membrane fusion protein (multidrug efflux system)